MGDEDDMETWERDQIAQDDEGDDDPYTCPKHGIACAYVNADDPPETGRCMECDDDGEGPRLSPRE